MVEVVTGHATEWEEAGGLTMREGREEKYEDGCIDTQNAKCGNNL